MSEYTPSPPETWVPEKPVKTLSVDRGSPSGPVDVPSETICEQVREQLLGLIAHGENLNVKDLDAFYRWMEDSYEALGFHPVQQQRFDEYCRSSCDSNFMRIFIGVWMLRLALDQA